MSKIPINPNLASPKTVNYLKLLFNEIGYTDNQSILFCRSEFSKPHIKHLDELTQNEASHVIDRLKEIRKNISGTHGAYSYSTN